MIMATIKAHEMRKIAGRQIKSLSAARLLLCAKRMGVFAAHSKSSWARSGQEREEKKGLLLLQTAGSLWLSRTHTKTLHTQ